MLFAFLLTPIVTASLRAQDPRPNECWGFVFGAWTPALDWTAAGHAEHTPHVKTPAVPSASTTAGAPRHDAARHPGSRGPTLVLYPTWWPVGVGISLDRDAALGDTVRGIAQAFVADGRRSAPESRILAWKKPCTAAPASRAVPDERRSLPEAHGAAPPPPHPGRRRR